MMKMNPSVKKSSGIEKQNNRFAFGVATLPKSMAATSEDIVNLLRQRRIIASSQIVDSLREHSDPAKLLDWVLKSIFIEVF